MTTNDEALSQIKQYLKDSYDSYKTSVIPKKEDLTFGNTIKVIEEVVVFYIDMRKSRQILTNATDFWSVKIHKSFLKAVTHCIEKREWHIRSFNWDWILAFFINDNSSSRAVKSALDIKGFVIEINDILKNNNINDIDFGIWIAQWKIKVAKSGKWWDDKTKQDLIWIGKALYKAVELSEFWKKQNNIWISKRVRDNIWKENYLNVVYKDDNKSETIWTKYEKDLKSENDTCSVRTTSYYWIIK